MSTPADFRPTVDDMGAIMRARTASGGEELGTFTTETQPTAAEVETAIDRASGLVSPRLGSVRDDLIELARSIVALRAAMLVETSYFPEEAAPDQSAYAAYREQYHDALADYDAAVGEDVGDGNARIASVPQGFLAAWQAANPGVIPT